MFGTDPVRSVVEIDKIAGADIDRAHTAPHRAGIDQVEVDQALERRFEWRSVVVADRFQRALWLKVWRRDPRLEEVRRAAQ